MSNRDDIGNTPVVFCRDVIKYYPATLSLKLILRLQFKRERTLILNNVNFEVREGEIFGIVGPNGAGKTTILKILCHLTPPTSGAVTICGFDSEKDWRKIIDRIGYCISEERSFFWRLTGKQNLEFFANLLEVPPELAKDRIDGLLSFLELKDAAGDRFVNYSSGMKQRMAVARSLLSDPDVLVMDEPTRGLDPRGASRLRNFIKEYVANNGKTAIVTTNIVSDIENLCQRIAALNHGRIIATGTISEIHSDMKETLDLGGEVSFEELFNKLIEWDTEKYKKDKDRQ